MKSLKYILLSICSFLLCSLTSAQDHLTIMLEEMPQSNALNPAMAPEKGGYMIAPGLGGFSFGVENTGFNFDDAFEKSSDDSLHFNIDKLAENISDINLLTGNIDIPILGAGFSVGKNFFTFDITNKTRADMTLPASILDIRYGNYDYDNNRPVNHSISDIYIRAYNYFDVGFGYSRQVTERLRIGGKLKLLLGSIAAYSDNLMLSIDTRDNKSAYSMEVKTEGEINVIAPLDMTYDEEGYVDEAEWNSDDLKLSSMKNSGFAADIGATYKLKDNLTLGVSILDLGFISWKESTNTFISDNHFVFDGVNVDNGIKDDPELKYSDSYWEQLEDSITQFKNLNHSKGNFKTPLSARMMVNVNYKPFKWLQAGGVVSGVIVDKRLYARVSGNATLRAGNWLAFIASLSLDPGYAMSFGSGLTLTAPGFQFFFIGDRIPASISKARSAQMRFGFNFPIGRKKAKDELPAATETEMPTTPPQM